MIFRYFFPRVSLKSFAFCIYLWRFCWKFSAFINLSNYMKVYYSLQNILTALSNLCSFPYTLGYTKAQQAHSRCSCCTEKRWKMSYFRYSNQWMLYIEHIEKLLVLEAKILLSTLTHTLSGRYHSQQLCQGTAGLEVTLYKDPPMELWRLIKICVICFATSL